MELLQLTYFITAAETENFTRAATIHSVPTSDISQTIKRLERELGTELFIRSANRVVLSKEGRIFLESAKKVLFELENAKRRIADSLDKISGEIKLLVLTNRRVVTEVIEKYHVLYPNVNFVLSHRMTEGEDYDIIISDTDPRGSGYKKIPLITEKVYLAFSKEGIPGLSGDISKKDIHLGELKNLPFISMPEHSSHYGLTKSICEKNGFTPEIAIKCDDPYYIRKYTEMGLGATFVPIFSWQGLLSDKIRFVDVGDNVRTTYLYLSAFGKSTRAVTEFVPLLMKECATASKL